MKISSLELTILISIFPLLVKRSYLNIYILFILNICLDNFGNQPRIFIPDILLANYATELLDVSCIEPQIEKKVRRHLRPTNDSLRGAERLNTSYISPFHYLLLPESPIPGFPVPEASMFL